VPRAEVPRTEVPPAFLPFALTKHHAKVRKIALIGYIEVWQTPSAASKTPTSERPNQQTCFAIAKLSPLETSYSRSANGGRNTL